MRTPLTRRKPSTHVNAGCFKVFRRLRFLPLILPGQMNAHFWRPTLASPPHLKPVALLWRVTGDAQGEPCEGFRCWALKVI